MAKSSIALDVVLGFGSSRVDRIAGKVKVTRRIDKYSGSLAEKLTKAADANGWLKVESPSFADDQQGGSAELIFVHLNKIAWCETPAEYSLGAIPAPSR